jgi:hypothetical protein
VSCADAGCAASAPVSVTAAIKVDMRSILPL